MGLAARKLNEVIRRDGPDAVAFHGSGQLYTEESDTANKLFKAGIRTNNVDGNARLCMTSAVSGFTSVFGKDEPSGSYVDIDHAVCFFLIGSNTYECHPPIFERIRRRRDAHPGTKLIRVDPSPYPMVIFAFFAQPLFPVVGVFYLGKVVRELRNQRIL